MNVNNPVLRTLLSFAKTTAFALYIFLFYELLAVPAILDWSIYGILLTAVLAGLLGWVIPSRVRIKWLVLAVTFLLSIKSLNNLQDTSLTWQIGGAIVIFAVLLFIGLIAGGYRFRHFATVFLIAVLITYTVDLTEIPFWSEFSVKWKSPLLYPKQTAVDYFPVQVLDVDGDGVKEIVTQGNLEAAGDYIEQGRNPLEPLEPEQNKILIFKWAENDFKQLKLGSYDPKKIVTDLKPDYINFPFYQTEWEPKQGEGLVQKLAPEVSKTELVEMSHDFGLVPFSALEISIANIRDRKYNLDRLRESLDIGHPSPLTMDFEKNISIKEENAEEFLIEGNTFSGIYNSQVVSGQVKASGILGAGKINSKDSAALLLGKTLQAVDLNGAEAGSLLGELTPGQVKDISTGELFTADLNSDGLDEILLNTENAKILQLTSTGKWKVLWNSRDDSFRFEDFDTLGSKKEPEIIALSKSVVRNNRTRYITGYQFGKEGLVTKWRVFTGLINLDAEDIDGDGRNELIGYGYRSHRIFVLQKHTVPVTQLLYGLTGLLIAYGFYHRIRQNKQREVA